MAARKKRRRVRRKSKTIRHKGRTYVCKLKK